MEKETYTFELTRYEKLKLDGAVVSELVDAYEFLKTRPEDEYYNRLLNTMKSIYNKIQTITADDYLKSYEEVKAAHEADKLEAGF